MRGFARAKALFRCIVVPPCSQILPSSIELRDQPQFLFSSPALQLLFARDRFVDVIVALPIHETDRVVLVRKSFVVVRLVLEDAPVEIVGHADIEGSPGTALEDVDVIAMVVGHASKLRW